MTCHVTEKIKIQNFTDLTCWKVAHDLAVTIYVVTKKYPKEELFGITSQMRRAAVSVGSNIAEGFSRQSVKEKVQFYAIAKGSLTELENQILLSRDVQLLSASDFLMLEAKIRDTNKLITGLIKYLRSLSS